MQAAFILLSAIIQSSELMAIRVISKFAYKEDTGETTTKLIHGFFLEVELGIREKQPLVNLMKEKLFVLFCLLTNCVSKWKLRDIILELTFYAKQNLILFCSHILSKSFQYIDSLLSQICIILILQFFSIVGVDKKFYMESITKLTSIPEKLPTRALILDLLKLTLKDQKESTIDNPILTYEVILTLYRNLSKYSRSILYFLYKFNEPFSLLMPAYVQQQTSLPKERKTIPLVSKNIERKDEEQYKKRLETAKEERKRNVRALSLCIIQVEREIQALKYEGISKRALVNTLEMVSEDLI